MIEIGRICIKTAGRDAGKKAVIIDILDDKFVLIDGETRRRKCNILHIEPLSNVIKISKGASHEEVAMALKELGITALSTKQKKAVKRKLHLRKKKSKIVKTPAKETKKTEAKKESEKPAEQIKEKNHEKKTNKKIEKKV